jgi:transcriptional regulator with XRE-family HTH domain
MAPAFPMLDAEVAELADALDSNSSEANTSCGFDPRLRHRWVALVPLGLAEAGLHMWRNLLSSLESSTWIANCLTGKITLMQTEPDERERQYVERVGDKLRRLRQDRSLSLQEVCDRSGGSFVVSTLSAYERGKRSLSLERLYELAGIYGQPPTAILDVEDDSDIQRGLSRNAPLRIRLDSLKRLSPEERRPLEQYLGFLRQLRNDPSVEMLTIRKDDLSYLSGLYGVRPQALKEYLEREGILLSR